MAAEEKKTRLNTENLTYRDGKIWFTEIAQNKLYFYDIQKNETTLFYTFADEAGERLFSSMVFHEERLFCVPFSASSLYVINIVTRQVHRIQIIEPKQGTYAEYLPLAKFIFSTCCGASLFMIGASYPAIVEYNYVENRVTYHTNWLEELQNLLIVKENALFRRAHAEDTRLLIPCCRGGLVLEFDMKSYIHKIYSLKTDVSGFAAVCKCGENYWLAPRKGEKIVCWDGNSTDVTEYIFSKNEENKLNWFNEIVAIDNCRIALLAGNADQSLLFDTKKRKTSILNQRLKSIRGISFCVQLSGVIYAFSAKSACLLIISKEHLYNVKLCNPEYREANKEELYLREDNIDTLEELLYKCINSNKEYTFKHGERTKGSIIWDYTKMI